MREKSFAFLRDNLSGTAAVLFLLVAGIASGATISRIQYEGQAASILAPMAAEAVFPDSRVLLLAMVSHGVLVIGGLLSGSCSPALLLWPLLLWGRGFLLGTALHLGAAVLPAWIGVVLLLCLLMEGIVLLVSLVPLYAIAGKRAWKRWIREPWPTDTIMDACKGLLLCALLQGLSLPLALSVLT